MALEPRIKTGIFLLDGLVTIAFAARSRQIRGASCWLWSSYGPSVRTFSLRLC